MGRHDAEAGQLPPWLTPRRGPIPRDVARLKEKSPFRGWQVPMLEHPHRRPLTHRPAVPRLSLPEDGAGVGGRKAGSGGVSTDALRASTARGASDEERKLFIRMSAVLKDGALPELNEEWKQTMARQMGWSTHLLREPVQDPKMIDRAKRCALVPPAQVPPSAVSAGLSIATPRGPERASFASGTAPAEACRQVLDDLSSPRRRFACDSRRHRQNVFACESKRLAQRISDSAIRTARLSRPKHITKKSEKSTTSLSPRTRPEEPLTEPHGKDEGAAAERIVDPEEPPFAWPDLLWYTPDRLEWQKNAGKPKPPQTKHEESVYKTWWNRLAKDEEYLLQLTTNQAYRGRNKANNMSEEEKKAVKEKAALIRFDWIYQQQKLEKFAAKEEKTKNALELKQKKLEEEQLRAEQLRMEREAERRKHLFRITNMVFSALCTDPETGLPIDPRVIFRRLDTDGGGTVDIHEFQTGLEVCGCELTDEELELVWTEIDGADGESDGQVDHETLVEKLKEVNEAQLKLVQPKLVVLLGNQSRAALSKLQREAERAQQSRDMLDAQQMPVKKREYAFAKKQKASFHMPAAAVPDPDGQGGTDHPEALQSAQSSPIKTPLSLSSTAASLDRTWPLQ